MSTFSRVDKAIALVLEKFNWFAKDIDDDVWAFEYEPIEQLGYWSAESGDAINLRHIIKIPFPTFQSVEWGDNALVSKQEILNYRSKQEKKQVEELAYILKNGLISILNNS